MDSMQAMMMGQWNRGKEQKVFDWDKAASIIKERQPEQAVAGLKEDMEWTAGVIWEEGHIVVDSYTYLASTWATPVLVLDDDEIIPCYLMASKTTYTSGTKWSDSAMAIIEGEERMKKVFSIEKYTSQCAKDGFVPEYGQGLRWVIRSEGKTKEEMNSMGLGTCDEWMIEVPDPIPQPPASESATSVHTPSCLDPLYGNRRVGSVVEVQGIPCRIKARKWCKGCILTGAPMDICYKYACTPYQRMDSKNVSFVRIKRL